MRKRLPDAFPDSHRFVSLLLLAEELWLLDACRTSIAPLFFPLWVKATLSSHFYSAIKKLWPLPDGQLLAHYLSAHSRMSTAEHRLPSSSDVNMAEWLALIQGMVQFTQVTFDSVTKRSLWASYCLWNHWVFVGGLRPALCKQGLNVKQWAHLCVFWALPPHFSMYSHT